MNQSDEKELREREVFAGFARVCPLAIDPASIMSRKPPEPDIRSVLTDGTVIAFELTEVIDSDVARRRDQMGFVRDEFRKLAAEAPTDGRLKKEFSDAIFRVMLHDPGHGLGSRTAVRALVKHLENPDSVFQIGKDEFVRPPADQALQAIKTIGIGRGYPGGPYLVTQGGSDVRIPAAERVSKKIKHTYETDAPRLELLVHVSRQPRVNDSAWVEEIAKVVLQELGSSQFARCWVYDHKYGRILLTCPQN